MEPAPQVLGAEDLLGILEYIQYRSEGGAPINLEQQVQTHTQNVDAEIKRVDQALHAKQKEAASVISEIREKVEAESYLQVDKEQVKKLRERAAALKTGQQVLQDGLSSQNEESQKKIQTLSELEASLTKLHQLLRSTTDVFQFQGLVTEVGRQTILGRK